MSPPADNSLSSPAASPPLPERPPPSRFPSLLSSIVLVLVQRRLCPAAYTLPPPNAPLIPLPFDQTHISTVITRIHCTPLACIKTPPSVGRNCYISVSFQLSFLFSPSLSSSINLAAFSPFTQLSDLFSSRLVIVYAFSLISMPFVSTPPVAWLRLFDLVGSS